MSLPLYFFDVLLDYFGFLDAYFCDLFEVVQLFVGLDQLSLQSLQLVQCALKDLVLFLLTYSVLKSHIRSPSYRCLCGLVVDLQGSLLKFHQSIVLEQEVNIGFLPGQFLKIDLNELFFLIQLLPQHCDLLILLNDQLHSILIIPLRLLISASIMHLPVLLGHSDRITLQGDLILEAVHGEVDLFVLFFGVGGVGFPERALEHEQLVLEGSDLFVVDFSLFLREFVDLVQEQAQVVDALGNAEGDGVDVHRYLNNSR